MELLSVSAWVPPEGFQLNGKSPWHLSTKKLFLGLNYSFCLLKLEVAQEKHCIQLR